MFNSEGLNAKIWRSSWLHGVRLRQERFSWQPWHILPRRRWSNVLPRHIHILRLQRWPSTKKSTGHREVDVVAYTILTKMRRKSTVVELVTNCRPTNKALPHVQERHFANCELCHQSCLEFCKDCHPLCLETAPSCLAPSSPCFKPQLRNYFTAKWKKYNDWNQHNFRLSDKNAISYKRLAYSITIPVSLP